jgi:hypothetical protein
MKAEKQADDQDDRKHNALHVTWNVRHRELGAVARQEVGVANKRGRRPRFARVEA